MFGLKADWSLDIKQRYFTLGNYAGGEARWCSGCGDHAILTVVQRICRDKQLPPEKTVAVSGIGCSSRLPHYMGTYGFHGLHGRALPVACGIKSRRPEIDVWVATGDGDCYSIGTGHWIHAVHYNMDMTVLVFDNSVYGLTKKQTSPTTPQGFKSNSHPQGAPLAPLNPLTVTLGITNVSFVAQTIDWNPVHLYETIKAAHEHRGFSLVNIIQRCPVYAKDLLKDLQEDPSKLLLLTHEKGIPVEKNISRLFPTQQEHDPSNMAKAYEIAVQNSTPIGLLYHNPDAPCYEDISSQGKDMGMEDKLTALNAVLDQFAI